MSYIKPNEDNMRYKILSIMPTRTQRGFEAIRFIGDPIPNIYTNGFLYFDDDDNLISDFTLFNDYYMPNVYSVRKDEPVAPKPNNTAPEVSNIGVDTTQDQINALNQRVDSITPYVETKNVYINDTECVFDVVKMGAISAQLEVENVIIPCDFIVDNGTVTVTFDALERPGVVTLTIQ